MRLKLGKLNIEWGKKSQNAERLLYTIGSNATFNTLNEIQRYRTNAPLYSIINRIAKTAATAPFHVYQVKDKKKFAHYKAWTGPDATIASLQKAMMLKTQVFEEDNSHPLNTLIDSPNTYQKGHEFVVNSIGYKLLTGNRFIWLSTLQGVNKVFEIYNLPPQHTNVLPDGTLFGVRGYEMNLGTTRQFGVNEIIHSKYWNPVFDTTGSHLRGMSPLVAAGKNLSRADAALERSVAMLQNAGAAGMIYNKPNGFDSLTTEQAAEVKRILNEDVLTSENAGKIAIANGDFGYLKFGMSSDEMNVMDSERYSMEQLCNIYMVPYSLFTSENSTYNNLVEAKKELITMACVPELNSLRDDFNRVGARYGDNIYVDYDLTVFPEMQQDMGLQAKIMSQAWWFTGNEKRIAMGQDQDSTEPMLDKYMIPTSLREINDLQSLDNVMNEVDTSFNGDSAPSEGSDTQGGGTRATNPRGQAAN